GGCPATAALCGERLGLAAHVRRRAIHGEVACSAGGRGLDDDLRADDLLLDRRGLNVVALNEDQRGVCAGGVAGGATGQQRVRVLRLTVLERDDLRVEGSQVGHTQAYRVGNRRRGRGCAAGE